MLTSGSDKKIVRVGMIGGGFMGKAHSHAYVDMPMFFEAKARPVLRVVCDIRTEVARQAAERYGWESFVTSWQDVVNRDDVDLVDIVTPPNTHFEIVLAAARAGKDILCEKPLAMSLSQAREMLAEVEHTGVKHMIGFNRRATPAIRLMKSLIDSGKIGEIYHFRASWLSDWLVDKDAPLIWRLKKDIAGSGAHGDLNSHLIDLAHFLVDDIVQVVGTNATFTKERPLEDTTGQRTLCAEDQYSVKRGVVDVDDSTVFIAKFRNGALGTFEATRVASGCKEKQTLEIYGSKGSLSFDFLRMSELKYFSWEDDPAVQGARRIIVTEPVHPYIHGWWPPGITIGYEHTFVNAIYDLMNYLAEDKAPSPNFVDGVKCQAVMEAVDRSVDTGSWVSVVDL